MRILVVEDEPRLLRSLAKALRRIRRRARRALIEATESERGMFRLTPLSCVASIWVRAGSEGASEPSRSGV